MAGGCCGGKSRKTLMVNQNPIVANMKMAAQPGMVLLEYTGPQTQDVRVNSRTVKGVKYRYSKGAKFYVYKEDADWLTMNPHFKILNTVEEDVESKINAPVLVAETNSPLPHTQERSVDILNLPPLVTGILKREGFSTVEEIDYATDQELLSRKGISDKRLAQIRKAIREIQVQR